MTDSQQRLAYLKAQAESIHQNLRFLESVVREPIGLTTDLKSLRESLAAEGSEEERDRQAFLDIVQQGQSGLTYGLSAHTVVDQTIQLLAVLTPDDVEVLPASWISRAEKVLERIRARLGQSVRRPRSESLRQGLYVILTPEQTRNRSLETIAEAATKAGAAALQLRDKSSDKAAVLDTALRLREICARGDTLLFVNDDADVARAAEAHGLHVGQSDLPIRSAREVLRPTQLVGKSNALVQEAMDAESESADYVAVGTIYPTTTKSDTRPAGLETLRKVNQAVSVPVVAIGGINASNAAAVVEAGADCLCVSSAVCGADDPQAAASQLIEIIEERR